MNSYVQSLLSPTPEDIDPEDITGYDDGTRARTSKGFGGFEEPSVVPRRRLHDDDDEDTTIYVKSSRAELFSRKRRGSGESDELDARSDVEDEDSEEDEEEASGDDDGDGDEDEEEEASADSDSDASASSPRAAQTSVFAAVGADVDLGGLLSRFDGEDADATAAVAAEAPGRLRSCATAKRHEALEADVMEFRVLMQSAAAAAGRASASAAAPPAARAAAVAGCAALVDAFGALRSATQGCAAGDATADADGSWEALDASLAARKPQWEAAAEAWRRRTHLGAAAAKAGLTAANRGPFDLAAAALRDVARSRRRMHPPRPGARAGDDDALDLEAYDDGPLYKAQLRDFLDRRPAKRRAPGGPGGADDVYDDARSQLGAARGAAKAPKLANGKRERATKGRKLRLEAHAPLQNFMFPVPGATPAVDVDMLFRSLFRN